ncbi:MAG TPA: ABC transporter substrate-binding protein [Pyrinomonadaceae bacterium]|jgi:ABC-type branched-subunit amino acid transport system substrate-binding protein
MLRSLKLAITVLAVTFFVASALVGALAGASSRPEQGTPELRPLTEQEKRGRAIYLRGESAAGRKIVAVVGELDVPSSTVTCAGCHGARGEGKTEGGVTAGNLTWSHLLKPYGHTHPTGRKHGPFNESSFILAVTQGVDPSGNDLLVAMPRYRISAEDMADLIAYLKRIEKDFDPGLNDTSMKIGVVLPSKGALAESGAAMKDVLAAYLDSVNSRGGIYNRKIELRVAEVGDEAAITAAAARAFARQEQVFAFVGGVSAGADAELAELARDQEIPFVAPSTIMPQTGSPPNRYVFYLLPGVAEQTRALVNFAASKTELKKMRAAIVYTENTLTVAASSAADDQAQKAGWSAITKQAYKPNKFDAARAARRLKQEGAEAVFFFGAGGEEAALIKEAAALGWTPHFFFLGVMTGRDLLGVVPTAFKGKIFLAYPTVPADLTPEGVSEFRALREKYHVAPRHTAAQLSAFAAAKIFVEGLQRAGRELSREKLITALESLYDFETGVTPRLTFGPNRRVGAAGAYVVMIDTEKKEFALASEWIKAY